MEVSDLTIKTSWGFILWTIAGVILIRWLWANRTHITINSAPKRDEPLEFQHFGPTHDQCVEVLRVIGTDRGQLMSTEEEHLRSLAIQRLTAAYTTHVEICNEADQE